MVGESSDRGGPFEHPRQQGGDAPSPRDDERPGLPKTEPGSMDLGGRGRLSDAESAAAPAERNAQPELSHRDRRELAEFHASLHAATPKTPVTYTIIALNVAVFGVMIARGVPFLSPTAQDMLPWGAGFGPLTMTGEWWRLLTQMFLHFGIIHLLFNMWIFKDAGQLVERWLGSTTFAALYLTSGLVGGVASLSVHPTSVTAGASGAVFGVIGALAGLLLVARHETPQHLASKLGSSLGSLLAINLAYGFMNQSVDMAAHGVGLLTGLACCLLVYRRDALHAPEHRASRAPLAVGAGAALVLALMSVLPWSVVHASDAIDAFAAAEDRAINAYNDGLRRAQAGELDDAAFAALVEADCLPEWRASRRDLIELDEGLPDSLAQRVDRLVDYATKRQAAWEALVEYGHTGDDAQVRLWAKLSRDADRLVASLGNADEDE